MISAIKTPSPPISRGSVRAVPVRMTNSASPDTIGMTVSPIPCKDERMTWRIYRTGSALLIVNRYR